MKFNVGFSTDIGLKRSQNQDSGAALPELGLFIVSDGMGGHRGGETASSTAVDIISRFVRKAQKPADWAPEKVMLDAIWAANEAIFSRAANEPALFGMGTTTTAILFKDRYVIVGHVGDSRCYFFRPHSIWQATRDHSLVQEKLRAGLISRKEIRTDRMKNVITRSVGFEKKVNTEIYRMEARAGDTFLLCSDGLSGMVEDNEILAEVQKNVFEENDAQKGVDHLVAAANKNGGDDNITAIIIQII